jgi:hypothetical protein
LLVRVGSSLALLGIRSAKTSFARVADFGSDSFARDHPMRT